MADKLGLEGGIWNTIANLNKSSGLFGYAIIAVLIMCWLISLIVYRLATPAQLGDSAAP